MSYKLFLDDIRDPKEFAKIYPLPLGPWTVIRSYIDFCRVIESKGLPNYISFDHDLAPEHYTNPPTPTTEKTGYDCALWLCDYCLTFKHSLPKYGVHSMNPVGKRRIEALLESFNQNHIK
jgi:hypothetical protein